jgi:subtilisin family serine protease
MAMTFHRHHTVRIAAVLAVAAATVLAAASFASHTPSGTLRTISIRGIPTGPSRLDGQILVKFRKNVPLALQASTIVAYRSRVVTKINRLGVYVMEIPADETPEEMVNALRQNPDVEYAEPNTLLRALVTPNDPLFKYQYALSNTGQLIGSVPGSPQGKASADIKAPAAWEETKGREDIVVAVVDSGVDMDHPDLKNKIVNSGKDFINNDNDATDDFWHGTFVAGIIGAQNDNAEGIAGVAWNCKILPVKVLDNTGFGPTDKVADGILWAADNGAAVINLSLGAETGTETLRAALKYAYDKGVVIVAAAGNANGNVYYPAAYDTYVLSVAATDYNDTRAASSNYGARIDVAAPGVRILSTVPTWYFGPDVLPYGYGDGTSFSAAHVSGLAALIKGLKTWLTPAQIMDIIRYSADDVNASQFPGRDEYLGYGRINMEKALVPLIIQKPATQ